MACGAPVHLKDAFFYHLKHGGQEFRFQGKLGFGGKFYYRPNYQSNEPRAYVSCYLEDETPERLRIIKEANAALEQCYDPG